MSTKRLTKAERERLKAVAYVLSRAAEGERVIKRSGATAAEARRFKRRVTAIADEIEQGMHL